VQIMSWPGNDDKQLGSAIVKSAHQT